MNRNNTNSNDLLDDAKKQQKSSDFLFISKKHEFFLITTFAVIGILLYWYPFLNGIALGPSGWGVDISSAFYSHIKFASQYFDSIPLFAPYKSGETYFFHLNAENPMFSPFNILVPYLSTELFIKVLIVLRMLVGWVGLFLLGRHLSVNNWLILAAFPVIFLSGYLTGRLFHGHFMVFAVVWVPLLMYLFLKALESKQYTYIFLASLVMSALFLDGGNHVLIWTGYLLLIFTIIETILNKSFWPFKVFVYICGLTLLFTAFKMYPAFLEYSNYEPSFLYGYSLKELIQALVDYEIPWTYKRAFPGDAHMVHWWEMYAYVGILPLIVSLCAIMLLFIKRFRSKYMLHILVSAMFFLWLTMGNNIRLINELNIPGLMYERHTTRMIIFPIILISLYVISVFSNIINYYKIKPSIVSIVMILLFSFSIYDYRIKNQSWMDYSRDQHPPYDYLTYDELQDNHDKTFGNWDIVRIKGSEFLSLGKIEPKANGVLVGVDLPLLEPIFNPIANTKHMLKALDFSESSKGAIIHADHDLLPIKELTYSVWLKAKSLESDEKQYIFLSGENKNTGLYLTNSNSVVFSIHGSKGIETVKTILSDKNWHNIVGTFNKNNISIYLDGKLVEQKKISIGYVDYGNGQQTINLGGDQVVSSHTFNGKMNQVSIWNVAMSDIEVGGIFKQGKNCRVTLPAEDKIKGLWCGDRLLEDKFRVFNNKDSYVNIPRSSSLDKIGQGAFSVLTWFKSSLYEYPGFGVLFNNCCITPSPSFTMQLNGRGNGEIRFFINSGKWDDHYGDVLGLHDGLWHMVVGVREKNGDISIFVDGDLDNKTHFKLGNEPIIFSKNDWRIGQDSYMNPRGGFGGSLDTVAVWNRALSSKEIKEIFEEGRSINLKQNFRNKLTGYWKLWENENFPILYDYSVNKNHGKLINLSEQTSKNDSLIFSHIGEHTAYFGSNIKDKDILVFRSLDASVISSTYLSSNVGEIINYFGKLAIVLPNEFKGDVYLQYYNPNYQIGKIVSGLSIFFAILFLIPIVRNRIFKRVVVNTVAD